MYKNYFKFSESPFENNLDQRFLFFSTNHKEVFAALLYFIKTKKSFAMVCGDVGTGKTMLINYLLNKLPSSVHPIMIMNPDVGYTKILRYVAGILKIDVEGKGVLDLVDHVKAALVEASQKGERFVLIIDEAHLLPDKSIEQIRLLSNIETQEYKLFQILLLGQYELSYKLNRPEMRQLRQRININRFLAPMDADETIRYIDHRLKMAGSSFDACFESNCKKLIFKMTNGVPRSINQLCDSAFLACMTEKQRKVNRKILKMAGTVLRSDVLFTPKSHVGGSALFRKMIWPFAAFGTCTMTLALFWIAGYWGVLGKEVQFFLHGFYSSVSTTVAHTPEPVEVPSKELQSSGRQTTGNKDRPSGTGASLPETKQAIKTEVPALPKEKTGDFYVSSSLQNPKRIVVTNGDTLYLIASRFFPDNIDEGLKKILKVNPAIDDMNHIYKGQKLIIPETSSNRKDPN
ncbi:MAG: AAA family ATPase [Smithella sp.]